MLNSQPYYFEDIVFQLELNLQSIRRELIKLLEEYDHNECYSCNRLRCLCVKHAFSIDSGRISDEGLEGFEPRPPSPHALPTPKWKTDFLTSIDRWVEASTEFSVLKTRKFPLSRRALSKTSLNWPPFAKSVWNDRIGLEAVERENGYRSEGERNSVDVFFGYFSKRMTE